ncbi:MULTISPECIES: ATPase, T2SS/T4P/T4SS family [unclassified Polaromonas]|jgi:twitching motility protein PilT|uniref:ATPase, T2SS/T4P/T4SS family n=1 Tax=unclassified Polaromonas TaxID=2638319 RepID=UPI000BCB555B|nr:MULTISPECIES: ATPase, T2SS/T4P/T4SS family [unclassified Polaromonas]OYY33353.1 MAG: secretion system protein E [Polaromonas sp. 35-63-35]OYZ18287.1 MAG: secretion system protein E [Polaromonas sp. 16-63-31]OYZ77054.1 MAG: secretion system protein E [Polaromonas sp. 24-63-21]OZA48082.1 MAG: secretion system protein E [Polaromonas sp. 17-63-33]OZA86345.1 MAG: secretion system protein E [Polaromonas sp. 39-63-25]
MALLSIPFTDLYLGETSSWMSGMPGTTDPEPPPEADLPELVALRTECEKYFVANPERESWPIRHAGISYRASLMNTISERVYVMRRLSETITPLEALGLPVPIVESLMRPGMTGLILFCGTFGQGKTTTASSTVYSRISKFGGVAVTVEEPPEMPLHGHHGLGVCYQTSVQQGEFGHACRQAVRWAPSIIFLGEIRDSETAIEALRASINGRLVICTAHADNCAMALQRVFALATGDNNSADDVLGMLASGLAGVLHQRLERTDKRKQLVVESLFCIGEDETSIRATIRQRNFEALKNTVALQKNRMFFGARKAIA